MGGAGETLERETEGEERGREGERGIRRLFWKIGSFNSLNYIPFGRVIEESKNTSRLTCAQHQSKNL